MNKKDKWENAKQRMLLESWNSLQKHKDNHITQRYKFILSFKNDLFKKNWYILFSENF